MLIITLYSVKASSQRKEYEIFLVNLDLICCPLLNRRLDQHRKKIFGSLSMIYLFQRTINSVQPLHSFHISLHFCSSRIYPIPFGKLLLNLFPLSFQAVHCEPEPVVAQKCFSYCVWLFCKHIQFVHLSYQSWKHSLVINNDKWIFYSSNLLTSIHFEFSLDHWAPELSTASGDEFQR